ncbi:MAG: hypothetical protein H5T65_11365 [Chloroflexi bacterium]|nr:hypothetical protein [Chloroflexota bacterium]
MSDLVGIWISALLTVMVLSYLLGDNPLYRLAEHLFVGTAVGYAVLVAYYSLLRPRLLLPLIQAPLENWMLIVPLLLAVLLLARLNHSWRGAGLAPLSFLLGVGVALAIGGALFGSILPQVEGTFVSVNPADGGWGVALSHLVLVIGTVSTLAYFYFTGQGDTGLGRVRGGFLKAWRGLGKWFIMLTFGALFAGTVMARLSLLIGRLQFLVTEIPKTLR